jgi:arylformamidase
MRVRSMASATSFVLLLLCGACGEAGREAEALVGGDTPDLGEVTEDVAPTAPDAQGAPETTPPAAPAVLRQRDLAYDPPPGVTATALATLDLHRPDDGVVRPLALLVHGGSWVGGDKANFEREAPAFIPWWLARGYAVAVVNFRLASRLGAPREVGPGDQARDIAHALSWLLGRASEYALAPDGVVAVGYSSGAHLVALLGADGSYLEAAGLSEEVLAATVSLDVHAYDVPYALTLMVDSVVADNIPLIRHLFGATEAEQLATSPIAFVAGWVAPAMLVSVAPSPEEPGTHGHIVARAADRYAAALRAEGHRVETLHDSAETHATLAVGFGADEDAVTEAVGAFLDQRP